MTYSNALCCPCNTWTCYRALKESRFKIWGEAVAPKHISVPEGPVLRSGLDIYVSKSENDVVTVRQCVHCAKNINNLYIKRRKDNEKLPVPDVQNP